MRFRISTSVVARNVGPELLPIKSSMKYIVEAMERLTELCKYAVFITDSLDTKNRETCLRITQV